MAKGSQLSQLKTALNQAGLSRPQQNGKKRKRAAMEDKDKDKDKDMKAAKMKEIHQKLNPFDLKVTRVKHDVGGRKITGTVGRPAQSKQTGMEQRKRTLLKELQSRNRAGGIVDRRFGENDPDMTPEERMLERFTREHQRTSKGVSFNLEDEDELTHYGQSLSKLDDFDNVGLGLDDDEEEETGQIDRSTVQKSHFGGFGDDETDGEAEDEDEDAPARKKTKAEVMSEVMAKSKLHKLQRQEQQEEDENLRHELDQELDSMRSLLFASDPLVSTFNARALSTDSTAERPGETDWDQEYDQYVRELVFEQRAKPKDRTKTEEEIAMEEKEALEKAERRRVRRMNGQPGESDDEEAGTKVASKGKRIKKRGADDTEDDFYGEEGFAGLGAGLREDGIEGDANEEDENENAQTVGGESEEGERESEVEGGSDGQASDASGNMEAEEGLFEALVVSRRKETAYANGVSKELPFIFPCPSSHDQFLEIVEDIDDNDVHTVVQRIRTLHHPSLADDNKFKLQGLTSVLVDHILYITSSPTPRFTLLSSLVPHLHALTKSYPIESAKHFVLKLTLMHKNLKRGLSHGVTQPDAKTWPGLPELSLLRVISQVWPTSDKNHHVVSPARLLMGSYLGLSRYEQLSQRFVPEAINFLANAILHLTPHMFANKSTVPGYFPCPDFGSEHCPSFALSGKVRNMTIQSPQLSRLLRESKPTEQDKVDLLALTLDLLGRFADMYKCLDGFIELYEPILELLSGIKCSNLPAVISTRLNTLRDTLGRLLKFSRQARRPLALQSHKPIPIPTYIPKFEQSSSNYLRNRDPDHERNEATKLRRQYKQERKGAIRELRKDARFLATEQQKQQKEKDRAYNDSMKRVFGSLESERAEEKAMVREKTKEKKRAGRK